MGRSLLKGMLMGSAASVALLSVVSISIPPPLPAARDAVAVSVPPEAAPVPDATPPMPEAPAALATDAEPPAEPPIAEASDAVAIPETDTPPEAAPESDLAAVSSPEAEPQQTTEQVTAEVTPAQEAVAAEPVAQVDADDDTESVEVAGLDATKDEPETAPLGQTPALDSAEASDPPADPVVPSAPKAEDTTQTASGEIAPLLPQPPVEQEGGSPEPEVPERVEASLQTGAESRPNVAQTPVAEPQATRGAARVADKVLAAAPEPQGAVEPAPEESVDLAPDAPEAERTQVLALTVIPTPQSTRAPSQQRLQEAEAALARAAMPSAAAFAPDNAESAAALREARPQEPIAVAMRPGQPVAPAPSNPTGEPVLAEPNAISPDMPRVTARVASGGLAPVPTPMPSQRISTGQPVPMSNAPTVLSDVRATDGPVEPAAMAAQLAIAGQTSAAQANPATADRAALPGVLVTERLDFTDRLAVLDALQAFVAPSTLRPTQASTLARGGAPRRLRGTVLPTPPGLRAQRPDEITLAQAQIETDTDQGTGGLGDRVVPLTDRSEGTVRVNRPGAAGGADGDTPQGDSAATSPSRMTPAAPTLQLPGQGARRIVVGSSPQPQPQSQAADSATSGEPAYLRNAAPFEVPPGAVGLLAVVLIDPAGDLAMSEAVAALDAPVSAAIVPSGANVGAAAALYGEAGKDILLAGAGLPDGATPQDAEVTLSVHLEAMPNAVGLMAPESGGFVSDRDVAIQVLQILAADGHGLVLWDQGLNPIRSVAERSGRPTALVYRQIDSRSANEREIQRRLDRAAFEARRLGGVIVVGEARPETLEAVTLWSERNSAGDIALAPVSALLSAP